MAKGKKSSSVKYVSKGQRPNVTVSITKAVARSRGPSFRLSNVLKAYDKGKNPWITIPNPDTTRKDKKFIRVRTNDWFTGENNKTNYFKMASV